MLEERVTVLENLVRELQARLRAFQQAPAGAPTPAAKKKSDKDED